MRYIGRYLVGLEKLLLLVRYLGGGGGGDARGGVPPPFAKRGSFDDSLNY